jgi:peroxiredoxin
MQRLNQGLTRLGVFGLALLLTAGCGSVSTVASGAKAPSFELTASDGKTHTLQSLTANGPVFFYGIKNGCPVNAKAEDFFDELARAYQGKVTFVGVSNLTEKTFPEWQKEYEPSYPVLFDGKKGLISGLGMKRSPWLVQVDKSGSVVKSWPGYSESDLGEMNAALAAAAGVAPAQLDFGLAPESTSYG